MNKMDEETVEYLKGGQNNSRYVPSLDFILDLQEWGLAVHDPSGKPYFPLSDGQVGLNIGCGFNKIAGYVNIDVEEQFEPDRLMDCLTLRDHYPDHSIDAILLHHILYGLYRWETLDLLEDCRLLLKPGGKIVITQPDLVKIVEILHDLRQGNHNLSAEEAGQVVKNMMAALIWYDEWMECKRQRYYLCKFPWATESLNYLLQNIGFTVDVLDRYLSNKHPQHFWRDSIIIATQPKEVTQDEGRENQPTGDYSGGPGTAA